MGTTICCVSDLDTPGLQSILTVRPRGMRQAMVRRGGVNGGFVFPGRATTGLGNREQTGGRAPGVRSGGWIRVRARTPGMAPPPHAAEELKDALRDRATTAVPYAVEHDHTRTDAWLESGR